MIAVNAAEPLAPYAERELLTRYSLATSEQVRRGRGWYDAARQLMAQLAAETDYTVEQAVAVMAITSPGAQVSTNITWTRKALESRGAEPVGRFPNVMAPKIAAVLADPEYAAEYVAGPKVGPFFRAILGDADSLVVDRWAYRAATGYSPEQIERDPNTKARGAEIEQAYRDAAETVGETVRDFQAIVWIHTRETTPRLRRGEYVAVRLADITAA